MFSDQKMMELISAIPGTGILVYSPDNSYSLDYIGKGAAKIFGCTENQLRKTAGNSFFGMIHPRDRKRTAQILTSKLAKDRLFQITFRIQTRSGEIRTVKTFHQFADSDTPENAAFAGGVSEGCAFAGAANTCETCECAATECEACERVRGVFSGASAQSTQSTQSTAGASANGASANESSGQSVCGRSVLCVMQDITKTELRNTAMFQALISMADDILFDVDCQKRQIQIYGDFFERFGRMPQKEEFSFEVCYPDCPTHDCDPDIIIHPTPKNRSEIFSQDRVIETPDGEKVWSRWQASILRDSENTPCRVVGRILNTDDFKKTEEYYRSASRYDSLTGIYNRRAMQELFDHYLKTDAKNQQYMLLAIDVDDFKVANDTYGHLFGDRVLQHLAETMERHFRGHDICGRIGGDEFQIILCNISDNKDLVWRRVEAFAAKAFSEFEGVEELDISLSVSVGACIGKNAEETMLRLYDRADKALYEAKQKGKGMAVLFEAAEETPVTCDISGIDYRELLMEHHINYDDALSRFMNNQELYVRFLRKFTESASFDELTEYLSVGNCEEAYRAACALKNTAVNLSFEKLTEVLVPMVAALQSNDLKAGVELLPVVKIEYDDIMLFLKEYIVCK
ncbi:MAG: sensor domain-containing diguanylate cyclase [Oscillospiraceae bacterium]|jgi:diguanylate cyclase (GGDEF)-like protein|nr:sensor domain-containing diguanylate cyclase [Oscillospiraceae bacterium]